MSFLGDLFNPIDALQDTWSGLASLPGTPEALGSGIYGGLNGDLSWNPYSQDNSVWDTGAGGTELSQDPNNRRTGRAIGTAIGAAFTGGALGAAGGEAGGAAGASEGAGSSALGIGAGTAETSAAPALSLSSQGAIDASAAGYGSGAGAGTLTQAAERGAARGAATNAGVTAASGGNGDDILKSGLYGGLYGGAAGGINYGVNSYNPGQYVTDNTSGQQIFNKGLAGAANSGVQGKSVGQGALLGAGTAGGNMAFGNMFSSGGSDDFTMPTDTSYSNYGTSGFSPPAATETMSGTTDDQQNPLKAYLKGSSGNQFSLDNGTGGMTPGASLGAAAPYQAPTFGGTGSSSTNPNMMSNLLGLYSAYKQHSANSGLASNLSSMYGQNSPYAQQMAQTLARQAAMSGRRSDIGSQQVALQAALAAGNSRNAPEIANLNNSNASGLNAGLNNLFQLYQGAGGYNGIANKAAPYLSQLSGMFGG